MIESERHLILTFAINYCFPYCLWSITIIFPFSSRLYFPYCRKFMLILGIGVWMSYNYIPYILKGYLYYMHSLCCGQIVSSMINSITIWFFRVFVSLNGEQARVECVGELCYWTVWRFRFRLDPSLPVCSSNSMLQKRKYGSTFTGLFNANWLSSKKVVRHLSVPIPHVKELEFCHVVNHWFELN